MKILKTFYFIRHGQTEFNRLRIIQGGGIDSSLNEEGRAQAQAFYDRYHDVGFQAVLTSKLKRTHETVAPFIGAGLQWEQFAQINEMDWGEHEGKEGTPEMREEYARLTGAWNAGDYSARIPGGESAAELGARVEDFIEILKKRPEDLLLVCAHGRLMRCLMCLLQEQPLSQMQSYNHANTGLYQTAYNGNNFRFLLENDTSHLAKLENLK